MNNALRAAFRALFLSLAVLLVMAIVVVTEGLPEGNMLAIRHRPANATDENLAQRTGAPAASKPTVAPGQKKTNSVPSMATVAPTRDPLAERQPLSTPPKETKDLRGPDQRIADSRADRVTERTFLDTPHMPLTPTEGLEPGQRPNKINRTPFLDQPGESLHDTEEPLPKEETLPPLPVETTVITHQDLLDQRINALQNRLDEFSKGQKDRQFAQLEQVTELMEQLQQQSKVQELERGLQALQQLQNLKNTAPGSETSVPPPPPAPELPPPDPAQEAAPSVLKHEPSPDSDERFSLQIKDAEIKQVLEMLGQLSGLNILASRNVTGKVTANLHNVNVEEALDAVLKVDGHYLERDGDFLYVYTAAEQQIRKQLDRRAITKVYRPNYISVSELQQLVEKLISPDVGKIAFTQANETGIASDNSTAGGDRLSQQDALMVHDYPEVIERIDNIILEMDTPPQQVVIEAMILSVRLTDTMKFGVNFALLNGSNNQLVTSGNGAILSSTAGFPASGTGNISPPPPLGQFLADSAGLKWGFIRGDISGFIEALENIADTNLIATPQLMVLNKQKAELVIGRRLSYPTVTFQNNQSIQSVNFIDSGTKLLLRPYISPDGLVRMEVHPERSSAEINDVTGFPDLNTTEVTTNVMVRDGTTVVIGGLIEEQVFESQARVPLLGALPLVGPVFRNKSEFTDRTELIVLITPRIVVEPEHTAEGEAARYESERRADHFRDHLTPVNRRNLSRIQYDKARQHFEQGDLDKARRYIDDAVRQNKNDRIALHLQAQIHEALRERNGKWFRIPGFRAGIKKKSRSLPFWE